VRGATVLEYGDQDVQTAKAAIQDALLRDRHAEVGGVGFSQDTSHLDREMWS